MAVETVEINVPKDMKIYVSAHDEKTELTRNALMLYPYIKYLTISHGRAAEILGIGKMELIELYADLGIPYFDMDISEIDEELRTYESIA